jgi:hypothetical protein
MEIFRTVIEQVLNVLWFLGVFSVYFLACHLVARWGARLMLPYRRVLFFSILALPYTFLWMFMRNWRFRQSLK